MGKRAYRACVLLLLTTTCHGMFLFHAILTGKEARRKINALLFEQFTRCANNQGGDDFQKENVLIDLIDTFVPTKVPVNTENEHKQTLLHLAAKYALPRVVRHLVFMHIDINAPDLDGNTALHVLAETQRNVCPNIPQWPERNYNIAFTSSWIDNAESISIPIEKSDCCKKKTHVLARCETGAKTECEATKHNDTEIKNHREHAHLPGLYKLVLKREALLKHKRLVDGDEHQIRAAIGEFLLQNGAHPDPINKNGLTPRDYASANCYADLAQFLLIFETEIMLTEQENRLNALSLTRATSPIDSYIPEINLREQLSYKP